MSTCISQDAILSLTRKLEDHPIYDVVRTLEDLRCFTEHHVYAVWDFMSLVKYVQRTVAPTAHPWVPLGDPSVRRFINALVLEEESDLGPPNEAGQETFASHFELYCRGMKEIGADYATPVGFVESVGTSGFHDALSSSSIPGPPREFMKTTFGFIETKKPHVVAAALALGREHIIPSMFRSLLKKIAITRRQAPALHYYLERHIHMDEDHHAPLSLRLLEELCRGDANKREQAAKAAEQAVDARIRFWDGVWQALTAPSRT
jgi:hypothetical protein